jgi:hypothetical protein
MPGRAAAHFNYKWDTLAAPLARDERNVWTIDGTDRSTLNAIERGQVSWGTALASEVPTMKLPRVRFTMRWMIVAVAMIALLLAGSLTVPRVAFCQRRLSEAGTGEESFKRGRIYTEAKSRQLALAGDAELSRRYHTLSLRYLVMQTWARDIRLLYEHAMWHPWLAAPSEPPMPNVQL